jgi:hypothetical protein
MHYAQSPYYLNPLLTQSYTHTLQPTLAAQKHRWSGHRILEGHRGGHGILPAGAKENRKFLQ